MNEPGQPRPEAAPPAPDLTLCEREPIHIPGATQPHGAVLAALADGHLVSHASANLAAVLGLPAEAVLGRPLEAALGEAACRALVHVAAPAEASVPVLEHSLSGPDGGTLSLRAHRSGRHICVDLEPVLAGRAPAGAAPLPVVMLQSILDTFRSAATRADLCELAVRGLKAVSGYDRVMAYRFHEDGHGEVIAEAREASLEPFLGLHYPASDIPPPARRLYLRQRVGMIADSSYQPVPLLVAPALDDGTPLDLTHSTLRSASPIHREFMRNMKTAASLTIGIAHRGGSGGQALWGMLVCHHATPRIAGPAVRAAAGMIGQVVSLLLASLGEAEVSAQRLARATTLRVLVERLGAAVPLAAALAAAAAELLGLMGAGGAVVRISGSHRCFGRTPPPQAAERALAALQALAGGEVLAIDDLGVRHPELAACTDEGAGAFLLPLAPGGGDAILLFRPELPRTVVWGGDPAERATLDPVTSRLSPRASFAAWKQAVRGRSAPWTDADLAIARELRSALEAEVARRTQAALRETEARLEQAQAIAGIGGWELDLGSGEYVWSRQLYRIFGVAPDVSPTRQTVAAALHPDDALTLSNWDADLAAGRERDPIEVRLLRPDGDVRVLRREGRKVVDPDGAIRRLAGTMQDVTRQRMIERRLAQAQKMEAIGQLAGGIAHNFNNLLGVIMANAEFLLDGTRDRPAERGLAEEILKATEQSAELTRNMLAFGGRQSSQPAVIDLNTVLSRHIALLRRALGDTVTVTATLSANLWHTRVDPAQAADVLSNLAINARDAMPAGGHLQIETANVALDATNLATQQEVAPGDYVRLSVTDSGAGMPPEVRSRAAEPFFTTKGPDRGVGLGLSMCFGFARQSGGYLTLDSEVGVGTTVRLYLPRADVTPGRAPDPDADVAIPGGNEAILLVEDDDDMRRIVTRVVTTLGYQVHLAADGAAALATLRSGVPVDLLITDTVMPGGMSGHQMARAAQALVPRLKVLFTAGMADLGDGGAPIRREDILQKPYRREDLARRIRTALADG